MRNAYINGYLSGYMTKVAGGLVPTGVKATADAIEAAMKQDELAKSVVKGKFPWRPLAVGGGAVTAAGGLVAAGNMMSGKEDLKQALALAQAESENKVNKLTTEHKRNMQNLQEGKGLEDQAANANNDVARLEQLGLIGAAGAAGGAGIGATLGKPGQRLGKAVVGGMIGAAGLPLAALLAEKISNKKLLGV